MSDLQREVRNVRRLGRLLAVLTILLLAVLTLYAWPIFRNTFFPIEGSRPITPRGDLFAFENVTIDVVKKASPSVTYVTTERRIMNPFNRRVDLPQGSGSGFIWDEQGHVVTNYHVVQSAVQQNLSISVILSDQTSYDAVFVGSSPDHDLAVLKISPPLGIRLVPIPIGKSNDLQVGQSVFAIGNPFGMDQTVTKGIISALKRTITGVAGNPIEDVVQTDAAINPGNSGGPLLDSAGRLIGVNTAIFSPSGSWSGIGFAIPVDTANRVVPQIISTGKYQRARLGVNFFDPLQRLLPDNVNGLAIAFVEPGSPADKAGLSAATYPTPTTSGPRGHFPRGAQPILGDVITHINDKPVKSSGELFTIMDHITPGDIVDLTVWKNGDTRHVKVTTTQ